MPIQYRGAQQAASGGLLLLPPAPPHTYAVCLQEDPTEHVNLLEGGGTAQHQLIAAAIKARIDEELDVVDGRSKGFFQANDIGTIFTRALSLLRCRFVRF
jgi:hypothetical protein